MMKFVLPYICTQTWSQLVRADKHLSSNEIWPNIEHLYVELCNNIFLFGVFFLNNFRFLKVTYFKGIKSCRQKYQKTLILVSQGIQFKVLLLTHQALYNQAPSCLRELLLRHNPLTVIRKHFLTNTSSHLDCTRLEKTDKFVGWERLVVNLSSSEMKKVTFLRQIYQANPQSFL